MFGSECDLKMHVQNLGYPPPEKSVPKTTYFRRLCELTANLIAIIFGKEESIDNRGTALETTRASLQSPQIS